MSISGLFNIARDAMASNQIAMDITGANIANANTPGYTRQRANFTASGNVYVSYGQIDSGVRVDSIERLYDRYLEAQIVGQAPKTGFDAARQEILGRVEAVFNESGSGGLTDSLSRFWNSWEALSANPTNQAARYSVVSAASNLASLFRESGNVLSGVRQDIQNSMVSTVNDINTLASGIADLNAQIAGSGSQDGSANNLLDSRMELLRGLADIINISYYENSDGKISVLLPGGKLLVAGNIAEQLSMINGNVVMENNPSEFLNGLITGGRLGAMIEMRETAVPGYLDSLDQLADGIVAAVNVQHQAGRDAYGAPGAVLFEPPTGAENMGVDAAILADPQKVAASSVTGNDGENARLIGAIKDSLSMAAGASTFNGFYASLVGRVGAEVNAASGSVDRNTAVSNLLMAQREEASGVSMDEEMIKLMKYQFGYSAAGRLLKVASDMLDVLMQLGK